MKDDHSNIQGVELVLHCFLPRMSMYETVDKHKYNFLFLSCAKLNYHILENFLPSIQTHHLGKQSTNDHHKRLPLLSKP